MTDELLVCWPCQMHEHFREGELLESLWPHQWRAEYALAMPNLPDPIRDSRRKNEYFAELQRYARTTRSPALLMTCQLTPQTPLEAIEDSRRTGVFAWKAYSQGITTNSEYGIEEWDGPEMHGIAGLAGKVGIPILLHLQDKTEDPLYGELSALARAMPLIEAHKDVLWSIEHPSRAETFEYMRMLRRAGFNITGTPTLHHATKCLEDVIDASLKCQPPIQNAFHRDATLEEILSGEWIKGRDAAAHPKVRKDLGWDLAPSGIWTPDEVDIPLTYQLFREHGGESWHYNMTRYMTGNAHRFYGKRLGHRLMPPLRLVREDWIVEINTSPIEIIPFMAGELLRYKLAA